MMFPLETSNPDHLIFTLEEMDNIVQEVELAGCPVSAHCGNNATVKAAVSAAV